MSNKALIEKILNELGTNLQKGLSEKEAQERLRKYGLNEVPEKE
jgi:H+-transporting ATPase